MYTMAGGAGRQRDGKRCGQCAMCDAGRLRAMPLKLVTPPGPEKGDGVLLVGRTAGLDCPAPSRSSPAPPGPTSSAGARACSGSSRSEKEGARHSDESTTIDECEKRLNTKRNAHRTTGILAAADPARGGVHLRVPPDHPRPPRRALGHPPPDPLALPVGPNVDAAPNQSQPEVIWATMSEDSPHLLRGPRCTHLQREIPPCWPAAAARSTFESRFVSAA